MVVTRPARLGLDLRGGTQIVLEATDSPDRRVDGDTVARTLEVLRRRVDQLGVAEPTLQRSGERRVIVELPGVYDPDEAVEVIGRTAQLTFHPVLGLAEPAAEEPATTQPPADSDELVLADEDGGRLRLGPAALTGEAVGDARAELDAAGSGPLAGRDRVPGRRRSPLGGADRRGGLPAGRRPQHGGWPSCSTARSSPAPRSTPRWPASRASVAARR